MRNKQKKSLIRLIFQDTSGELQESRVKAKDVKENASQFSLCTSGHFSSVHVISLYVSKGLTLIFYFVHFHSVYDLYIFFYSLL